MSRFAVLGPVLIRTGRAVALVLLIKVIGGCVATRWEEDLHPVALPNTNTESTPEPVPLRIVQAPERGLSDVYNEWKGTPYQFGGTTRDGIDCSAFTQKAMSRAFGVTLPRTTAQQQKQGVSVTPGSVRPGDLVFFKTGESLNHVGVMMGPRRFLHASTSNGVTISRVDDSYWESKLVGYRRVTP